MKTDQDYEECLQRQKDAEILMRTLNNLEKVGIIKRLNKKERKELLNDIERLSE